MNALGWIGVALGAWIIGYVLKVILWPAWSDIPREQFAHWIHALIRYYEDSASLLVMARASSVALFRFSRVGTKGDGCIFTLEILDSPLARAHKNEVMDEIRRQRYEPVVPDKSSGRGWPITVKVEIEDIWQMSAGNRAARLAHAILDAMNVDKDTRFKLSRPSNKMRSRERTLEARRRQKQGLDLGGTDLKK